MGPHFAIFFLKNSVCPPRFKDHPTLNERYLLLHLLGRGGFSEVYKVTSEWLDYFLLSLSLYV